MEGDKRPVLKTNKTVIKNVMFYGIEHKSDDHQIATQFNNYFVNIIKSINNTIQDEQYLNNLDGITNRFKFRAITTEETKNVCKSMKNKKDYNNVTIQIIVDNWNILGTKIRDIINMSMRAGVFPGINQDILRRFN